LCVEDELLCLGVAFVEDLFDFWVLFGFLEDFGGVLAVLEVDEREFKLNL
jgi:hypothetical protein